MRCSAYCVANSHRLNDLERDLLSNYKIKTYFNSLHIISTEEKDIFLIYGCAIFWGLSETEEKYFLELFSNYAKDPVKDIEFDQFEYEYSDIAFIGSGFIKIPHDNIMLSKLSISFGLAQSVKLSVFENQIDQTISETEAIPKELALKGGISLSRKEISQKIGGLFIARNSINLYSDILDIPDFFWDYPDLERLYKMTVNDLDVKYRTEVLNKRLNIIHDLFEILSDHLNSIHSSHLEMTIILLIVIEVIMSLLHFFKF